MSKILVSGLINVETTLQIDEFPLSYFPVRYPFYRGSPKCTVRGRLPIGINSNQQAEPLFFQVGVVSTTV